MSRNRKSGMRREGQSLVEYALILVLVALAAIAGLSLMGAGVNGLFSTISGSF